MASHLEHLENQIAILEQVRLAGHGDVLQAFRTLLEDKCLYQRTKVIWKKVESIADTWHSLHGGGEGECLFNGQVVKYKDISFGLKKHGTAVSNTTWVMVHELQPASLPTAQQVNVFTWPPAELYCRNCKRKQTHLSGSLKAGIANHPFSIGGASDQVFNCAYQCQSCRTTPIIYQVTRHADKMTLTGCSEYPHVAVFDNAPDEIRDYLSEAIVATSTGRILAGLFFLRTAVEQHMRLTTGLTGRATGDEIASTYFKKLSSDFPQREWVLGRVYEDLSEKLHAADGDAKQFDKSYSELSRYFQVLKLYPFS